MKLDSVHKKISFIFTMLMVSLTLFCININNYSIVLAEETNNIWNFDYTGEQQEFIAPKDGIYKIETWGAQGGSYSNNLHGGYGAYAKGTIKLKQGEKIYINIGGAGSCAPASVSSASTIIANGGYNGGGNSYRLASNTKLDTSSCSGGGATHISTVSGLLSELEDYRGTYNKKNKTYTSNEILMVAAGGGGATYGYDSVHSLAFLASGGSGGGYSGSKFILDLNLEEGYSSEYEYYNYLEVPPTQNSSGRIAYHTSKWNEYYDSGLGWTTTKGLGSGGGSGWFSGVGTTYAFGGSSYIGSSKLKTYKNTIKSMYCYNCEEANDEEIRTISTTNISTTPTSEYAKEGNGYAKISFLQDLSSDNNLTDLKSDYGTLNPSFVSGTTGYKLTLDEYTPYFTLSAQTSNDMAVVSGLGKYTIEPGETKNIDIVVTAEDGNINTYTVEATRNNINNQNHSSKLSKLEISGYGNSLNPKFHPSNNNYNIKIANGKFTLNINTETFDNEATVKIEGNKYIKNDSGIVTITVSAPQVQDTIYRINYTKEAVNQESSNFEYTGDYQTFIAPYTGKYKIEAWGAQGIGSAGGAYTSGNIDLIKNQRLYIYVGEGLKKTANTTSFNGGKSSGNGYPGGGATDIRLTPSDDWREFNSLKSRIMVAAGSGASYDEFYDINRGAGGKLVGLDGDSTGATQTSAGIKHKDAFLDSGFGYADGGNAGGGGYYGGGAGEYYSGGGSSFISGYDGCNAIDESSTEDNIVHTNQSVHYSGISFKNPTMLAGNEEMPTHDGTDTMLGNEGNGYAKITPLSVESEDNYLTSLSSNNGTLSPSFDPAIEEYELNLGKYDINFTLSGTLSDDEKASVTGLDTKYVIKFGETKTINVVVTSESGDIRTYTIKAKRVLKPNDHSSELSNLIVKGYEDTFNPEFHPLTKTYNLNIIINDIDVDIITEVFDDEAKVEITGNKYIKNSAGTITIKVTEPHTTPTTYIINYTKEQIPTDMPDIYNFDYTGGEQVFNPPVTGDYLLETWGSAGGVPTSSDLTGAVGGYSKGTIKLYQNEDIYINVGGQGGELINVAGSATGGYNGGGIGFFSITNNGIITGGGGATHIARKSGLLNTLENDIDKILIVSGGGSGYYYNNSKFRTSKEGIGGGYIGGQSIGMYNGSPKFYVDGGSQSPSTSTGTEQFRKGMFGAAPIPATDTSTPGAGGGFYGGNVDNYSAGGGSGYIGNPLLKNKVMYCYNCEESDEDEIRTISTTNYSVDPISEYAKGGSGYAKITPMIDTTSKDNYLSSLSSNNGTLSPSFDPIINEYELSLDKYDINFTLSGTLSDEKASVIGLDEIYKVKFGKTKTVNVVVTAENGNIKTYTIKAKRESLKPGEHSSKLASIEIYGYDEALDPEFHPLTENYQTTILSNEIDINIEAIPFDDEATVEITGNKYIKEEDTGVVTIVVTEPHLAPTTYTINYTKVEFESSDFDYTGDYQTFVVPATGQYKLETWGAQGGNRSTSTYYNAGYGGYSRGMINLTKGQILYVYIGGQGEFRSGTGLVEGGYNGGGSIEIKNSRQYGSGGGATHIAKVNGLLSELERYKGTYFEERKTSDSKEILIVSGGGSGFYYYGSATRTTKVGHGGGYKGNNAIGLCSGCAHTDDGSHYFADGGGQTLSEQNNDISLGLFGQGFVAAGGGFYGGNSKNSAYGGGSGYIGSSLLTQKAMYCYNCEESEEEHIKTISTTNVSSDPISEYAKQGNGYAKISASTLSRDNYLTTIIVENENKEQKDLTPIFDPKIEDYELNLDVNETKIKISARPSSDLAIIEGLGEYEVEAGTTIIPVTVTSESGDIRVYNIKVVREASSESKPKNIEITGLVPSICEAYDGYCALDYEFDPDRNLYKMTVPAGIRDLEFTVDKGHKYQEVSGDGVHKLGRDLNTIKIQVISEDKDHISTYTYEITRNMTGDNYIDTLEIVNPSVDIGFHYLITEYSFSVGNEVTSLEMNIKLDDENASYVVKGNEDFKVGNNIVDIEVTAENGEIRNYILIVYRVSNSNVFLRELSVKNGETNYDLSPGFKNITTNYTVNVGNEVDKVEVNAAAEEETTSVTGTGEKTLKTGPNEINVITTAEDGSMETYKIIIIRAKSSNNYLSNLTSTNGVLTPAFDKENTHYEITVNPYTKMLNLNVELEDQAAKYQIINNNNFKIGENLVTIKVEAENKEIRNYYIAVTKEGSENNYLASLNSNIGSLDPAFDKETLEYNIEVENEIENITLTGQKEDSLAKTSGFGTYKLVSGENKITIKVTSETGKTREYVVKVNKKPSADAFLKNIIINEGILAPEFNSTIKEYTVNVTEEIEEIIVKGVPSKETSMVEGNKIYKLNSGDNEIILTVTAEDGITKEEYKINVIKDESSNANLSFLLIKEGILKPAFDKMILNYEVKVPYEVTRANEIAEAENPLSIITVAKDQTLKVGENKVNILVTAEDGNTKTYEIKVIREEKTENNLNLKTLDLTSCNLNPAFDKNNQYYECEVPYEVIKTEVNASAEDENNIVEGLGIKSLKQGKNVIGIRVKDEGEKTKDYQVLVTRKESTEARLRNIVVTNHSLNQAFDKDIEDYSLTTTKNTLDIKYTKMHEDEEVQINGQNNLKLGLNKVTLTVTSPDKEHTKTYTINVLKERSNNNYLTNLTVDNHKISPTYKKGITNYTVEVENEENSIIIRGQKEDPNAVVRGLGMHSLSEGEQEIKIEVEAENGEIREYIITVIRLGSKNNYLKTLEVENHQISPAFDKETSPYTLEVEYEEETIEIKAQTEEESAIITGDGIRKLDQGLNNLKVVVTSEYGNIRIYEIKVTRKDPVTAKLKNIEITNYELDKKFDPETEDYIVTVDNEVTSLDLTITKLDPNSTYVIEDNENFVVGLNKVKIISTSSDKVETKTYTLTVNRQNYSNTYLSNLSVTGYNLNKPFDKKDLKYEVTVPYNETQIEIKATKENATSKVSGDGIKILTDGENKYKITVTSEGGITRDYIIEVKKEASNIANILNIKSMVGKLNKLNEFDYELTVPKNINTITKEDFIITLEDAKASIVWPNDLSLDEENKIYEIKIISPDGSKINTYSIHVKHELSDDSRIKELEVNTGTLTPEFNMNIYEGYTLNVLDTVSEVEFEAILNDRAASIINTSLVFELNNYKTEANILVQAEDGSTSTYKITIEKSITTQKTLKNIEIKGIKEICEECEVPVFEETKYDYEKITVPYEIEKIDFKITKNHPNQEVIIYKDTIEVEEYTLDVGINNYKIEVTNSLGEKLEYNYIIERLKSDNNYLKILKLVSPEYEFIEFDKEKEEYSVQIPYEYERVEIEAKAEDEKNAKIKIEGYTYLLEGNNDVKITVSAQNGDKREYIIHVLRTPESNNLIKTLTVSSGDIYELSPKFTPGINDYTLKVPNVISRITIEALPDIETTTLKGDLGEFDLKVGPNKYIIESTSTEGQTRTYTITITRDSSKNVYLKTLEIRNGILNEVFRKDRQNYTVNIGNEVENLDMLLEAEDPEAIIEVTGNKNLFPGENTVKIKVSSKDKTTAKTYVLTVTKEKSSNNNLTSILIDKTEIEGFNKDQEEYNIEVENDVTSVNISAITEDKNAIIKNDGIHSLGEDLNQIKIIVEAENGEEKEYTLNITRKPNTYLDSIITDRGAVNPAFDKKVTEYEIEVEEKIEDITIIGLAEDKQNGVVTGNNKYDLDFGENKITLTVTNKGYTRDYIITVIRKTEDNCYLKYLSIGEGILDPAFEKTKEEYNVRIPNEKTSLTLDYKQEDPNSTVEVIGNENLDTGSKVQIKVTSKSGKTKNYEITITKEIKEIYSNKLIDLSTNKGTLDPVFNKDINLYKVMVEKDITEIRVNAQKEDKNATIEEGIGTHKLNPGRNEIKIKVVSKDNVPRIYTIIVYRGDYKNANLKTLEFNEGRLMPIFNKTNPKYTLIVPSDIQMITEKDISTEDAEATYEIIGDKTKIEEAGKIIIRVTAADKITTKDYEITLKLEKSNNAYLKELHTNVGTLSPAFEKTIKNYTIKVGKEVKSIEITAKAESTKANVDNAGIYILTKDITYVNITVTAENGVTNVYPIKIEREKSNNAYLKELVVRGYDLNETFDKEEENYTLTVPNEETKIIVEAKAEDELSNIVGTGEIDLKEGENKIPVIVTAQDGSTKTYTITVIREEKTSAKIKNLEIEEGVLSPEFNSDIEDYTINIPNEYTSITPRIETEEIGATVEIIGNENFIVGSNKVQIKVTSKTGEEKTYEITVVRLPYSNNFLSNIIVDKGTLTPVFNRDGKPYYEVEVEENVEEITVEAIPELPTTKVTSKEALKVEDGSNLKATYKVEPGENKIIISASSASGIIRDYQIKIKRKYSSNNYLKSLDVSVGNLNKVFDKEDPNYEVIVEEGTEEIEIFAEAEDENASISGNRKHKIEVGSQTIQIIVTAANGDIRTYEITITRNASTNTNITTFTPSTGILSPSFTNDNDNYTLEIGKDIDLIDFEIIAENKDASISGNKNILIDEKEKKVQITVTAEDGSTRTITVTIKKESAVTDILLEKETIMISEGEEYQIQAKIMPEEAQNKELVYKVLDEEIISVDEKGKIIGKKIGNTSVTITSKDNENIEKILIVNVILKEIKSKTYDVIEKEEIKQIEGTEETEIEKVKIIIGMEPGVTLQQLIDSLLNEDSTIKIYDKEENEITDYSETVKTGQKIKLIIDDVEYDNSIIIVRGDIDGDGDITVTDSSLMLDHILMKQSIEDYRKYAADIDLDEDITVTDSSSILDYILGKVSTLN